jgi:hypothetical protein
MEMSEERRAYFEHAERLNGRFAMMGFVIGVATELITGQGIVSQVLSIFK